MLNDDYAQKYKYKYKYTRNYNNILYYYILLYIMTFKLQILKKLIDEHFEKINKLTNIMQQKNITDSNISWATEEYINSIITSEKPDVSRCNLIKDIEPKKNEGRHNNGIGFVNIEDKEYFLKYGYDLFNEFKIGYHLSKLRSEYPYFLNVHSLLECDYISSSSISIKGQVMIVDKGTETIYSYLNRKSKEYILYLIPDLEARVNELDEKITEIINNLSDNEKELVDNQLQKKTKQNIIKLFQKLIN